MKKKVAIVTGGRRGIGFGISRELGREGYYVAMAAHSADASEAIELMKRENLECCYIKCDVSVQEDRENLVNQVMSRFGRLDVLVNNAGVAPKTRLDILETTEESYDYVVNTNTKATFFMCQKAANEMIKLKKLKQIPDYRPRIVNISSMSAYTSSVNRGEYCISKAGISMITMLFADRLAQFEIPVFEIRPGIILTDMTSSVKEKYQKLIDEGITPIRRFGTPEDVADCVAAACSGRLDFGTGQILNADGGFHLRRL